MKLTCLVQHSFLLLTISFGLALPLAAQSKTDFLNSKDKKATWLGIDYSELRIFGDSEADANKIKDDYLGAINDLVINEPDKYFVAKAFQVAKLEFDLTEITKINKMINPDSLIVLKSSNLQRLTSEMVQAKVSAYDLAGKSGYGILFMVDEFNKSKPQASMYVVVIDMGSKKVLIAKRLAGEAAGFGFRNYWARPVYEVLKTVQKPEYDKWKSGKS